MKAIYKVLTVLAIPAFLVLYSFNGGSPGGKTGSLGDGGDNCTSCHQSTAQNAADWITTDIPESGYVPGETYTITAKGTHDGVGRFGFELTAENEDGIKKGTFAVTDTERTKAIGSGSSITHTAGGTTPSGNSATWTMSWTAPASGSGEVNFNAAFNAANGNGSSDPGDIIYLSMSSVDENLFTSVGEDYLADQISMYPNPARNMVNLNLPEGAKFHLVNLMGQVLLSRDMTGTKESLDISDYDNGVYFVQVIHNGATHTSRLLKN